MERLGGGDHIASDYVDGGVIVFDVANHLVLVGRISLRRVDDNNIDALLHESLEANLVIWPRADRSAHEQLPLLSSVDARGRPSSF